MAHESARRSSQSRLENLDLRDIYRNVVVMCATVAIVMSTGIPASAQVALIGSKKSTWWVRPAFRCTGVQVWPRASIQAKINAHAERTTFCIHKGVHRLTAPLQSKRGDRFIGQGRAVLSGARVLRSFGRSGSYWVATGQTQESAPVGLCSGGYTGCRYNEDVYMDNKPLWQVTDLSRLGPGRFYFDYGADAIYLADNPTGHRVEATVALKSFWGGTNGVKIMGLTIEKFSNPAQDSCVGGSRSGVFAGNEVRFCHGIGVGATSNQVVRNNWIHHMGEMGVSAPGAIDAVFHRNEIAYNNTMGFYIGWEAGGSKFAGTTNLIVTANFVHHNIGPGLWTDGDNIHTLYADNVVERNSTDGIVHEISYNAVVRDNVVRYNGVSRRPPGWGAGILVAASPNVRILRNVLKGNRRSVLLLAQDRGSGAYGSHILKDNHIHHNTIVNPRGNGLRLDGVSDPSYYTSQGNHFQYNTYYLRAKSRSAFYWMGALIGRARWVGYGQDTKGRFIRL
jgi:hypothetical protein